MVAAAILQHAAAANPPRPRLRGATLDLATSRCRARDLPADVRWFDAGATPRCRGMRPSLCRRRACSTQCLGHCTAAARPSTKGFTTDSLYTTLDRSGFMEALARIARQIWAWVRRHVGAASSGGSSPTDPAIPAAVPEPAEGLPHPDPPAVYEGAAAKDRTEHVPPDEMTPANGESSDLVAAPGQAETAPGAASVIPREHQGHTDTCQDGIRSASAGEGRPSPSPEPSQSTAPAGRKISLVQSQTDHQRPGGELTRSENESPAPVATDRRTELDAPSGVAPAVAEDDPVAKASTTPDAGHDPSEADQNGAPAVGSGPLQPNPTDALSEPRQRSATVGRERDPEETSGYTQAERPGAADELTPTDNESVRAVPQGRIGPHPSGSAEPLASSVDSTGKASSTADVRQVHAETVQDGPRRKAADDGGPGAAVSEPPERTAPYSRGTEPTAALRAPRAIGGRRNQVRDSSSARAHATGDRATATPRPELICRNTGNRWEVLLSADDECNVATVEQNGDALNLVDGEYPLPSLAGRLSIVLTSGERSILPLFEGRTPLIFKLRGDWIGVGRKVGGISSGYFIVIAPDTWRRTGHVPVEPEACSQVGFTAHYFSRESKEANDVGNFIECEVALTSDGFKLDGRQVFDEAAQCPLFVGDVPMLHGASNVVWARVGEEEDGGWTGANFNPSERSLADVLEGRQGRFFLRVYDDDVKLLDSMEFRYCADLREIRINGAPYTLDTLLIPPAIGHPPAEVRFLGTDGATISPILTGSTDQATVREGVVVAEPHPDGDDISCALESGAGLVSAFIRLPRIWWRIDSDELCKWRDTPMAVTRREFREYADADSVIRIRLPKHLGSIKVGFDDEQDRVYRPASEEMNAEARNRTRSASVPLEEFADCQQISQPLSQDATLIAACSGGVLPLIQVSADPIPEVISFSCEPATISARQSVRLQWKTRNAECITLKPEIGTVKPIGSITVTPPVTTTYKLTLTGVEDMTAAVTVAVRTSPCPDGKLVPRVACRRRRLRAGKGFSARELRAAGVTAAEARHRSIPFDPRRRSSHTTNAETLRKATQ